MIKSMTGFGRAQSPGPESKYLVEIRSLNSKQLELSLRLPSLLRSKESDLRNIISSISMRGKVDVSINSENMRVVPELSLNRELAKTYFTEIKSLADELGASSEDTLSKVLQLPDVLKSGREEIQEISETEWNSAKAALEKALEEFDKFRKKEGKTLETELKNRIGSIMSLLKAIEPLDKKRFVSQKSRIRNLLSENFKKGEVDENRFEQEMFYYFEKLDITEEKLRLKTHCDYFIATMKEDAQGRKLGFITQEIGREINTIGSKANDATIQQMVVQMKDELEKVKEQLMNVL